jgi:hypothetical protein
MPFDEPLIRCRSFFIAIIIMTHASTVKTIRSFLFTHSLSDSLEHGVKLCMDDACD